MTLSEFSSPQRTALIPVMMLIMSLLGILAGSSTLVLAYNSMSVGMHSNYNISNSYEVTLHHNAVALMYNAAKYGSKGTNAAQYIDYPTSDDIKDALEGYGGWFYPVHVLWISHGGKSLVHDTAGNSHVIVRIFDVNGQVLDNTIHDMYQYPRPIKLVFLWSCYSGITKGETFDLDSDGIIIYDYDSGMPHAWLYTTDLSFNGYYLPDGSGKVFIGWYGPAPYLSSELFGFDNLGYKFLIGFYIKLYGYYTTPAEDVNRALDYATSYATNGEYYVFGSSPLMTGFTDPRTGAGTWMVVYGDGGYDWW